MPTTVIVEGLFNAENLAITDGRVFVTGSRGVYEVLTDGGPPRLSEIPIRVEGVSDNWLRNGIASDGKRLYLACAHVHHSQLPLLSQLFNNAPDIEQTPVGFGKLMVSEIVCGVDSFIVSANLEQSSSGTPLAFTQIIASSGQIRPGHSILELFHRCFGSNPNGLRVDGTQLYYSALQTWPYPAAVLRRVDLATATSRQDISELLVTRFASVFDDFDVLDSGFVIAEIASWRRFPLAVGGLLFFSKSGDFGHEIRTSDLVHSSSVRLCRGGGPDVTLGELLLISP